MREILFRGKRFSNGEWVIGGIMKTFHPNYDCENEEEILSQSPNCYCICANNKDYFVEQASIGQYTGLADKNGKKIFEGDVVATKYKLGRGGYYVFEVYYNENLCQFALTINSGSYTKNKQYDWLQLTELKANKIEVIGNIHDNPELLRTPQNDEVRE